MRLRSARNPKRYLSPPPWERLNFSLIEDNHMPEILSQTEWLRRARAVLPGGGFGNFDPAFFIREGHGSRIRDEDGREYVDALIGSGPLLLGHCHPEVLEAVAEQLPRGTTFFANNTNAVEFAETIVEAVRCAEQIRFMSTGGEADMYAIRLARAFTGRHHVVKFEGGYHGMSAEAQMSLAPSRLVNFPQAVPDSAGIPTSVQNEILVAPYNDADYIRSLLDEHANDVAAILVEPLQRMIPSQPGFLRSLREEADRIGALLIFDEVVTGFRLAYGGAQELYGVIPDIVTLGKVIGGGFPLAAVGARTEIMKHFDRTSVDADRWLMQIGTLSGNPVAAAAGIRTLEILRREGQYEKLRHNGRRVMRMASEALCAHGVAHRIVGEPPLFEVVFTDGPVRNYRDYVGSDMDRAARFHRALIAHDVFKSPGKTYISLALTEDDFDILGTAYSKAAEVVVG